MSYIAITAFNELNNFPSDTDYYRLLQSILNNILDLDLDNHENIYKSINDLRIFNKLERSGFSKIFDVVYPQINKLLTSPHTHISLLILILLSEIFIDTWRYNEVNDWLRVLLPSILTLAAQDQYLSAYAMNCLNLCATNGFYDDVLTTLLEEINESCDKIQAEYSFNLIVSIINNCDNMLLIEGLNWDPIFDRMCDTYLNSDRMNYIVSLCEMIKLKFTREELFNVLANVEDEYIASVLNEMFKLNHIDRVELNRIKFN
jgi:hypothetical protein